MTTAFLCGFAIGSLPWSVPLIYGCVAIWWSESADRWRYIR